MLEALKTVTKQLLPHGICEYSIRRHEYVRCGFPSGRATRLALSPARYQSLCDSRLNLFPKEITASMRTCVDAGAHRGAWTEALLQFFQPQRVVLLECEPRLVSQLHTKFSGHPNVEIIDAALADTSGKATFYQLRHPASSSLLQPNVLAAREYEDKSWDVIGRVPVRTIDYDQLVAKEQEVSVLKLDIQGAERAVLTNSRSGIKKTESVLLEVNFTPHYSNDAIFPELHSLMMDKGFGLYRLSSVYHRGGRALFADAVYVQTKLLNRLYPGARPSYPG
jgi:FkbM family methyltransferase